MDLNQSQRNKGASYSEEKAVNSYDFDQTIFYPDSSYCFVMYCLKKYPGAVLKAVPGAVWAGLGCLRRKAEVKELKEHIFAFLKDLQNVDELVKDFWEQHRGNIASWYLAQKRPDDLIISASPEFLLKPIAEELGVHLIATRMDKHTGKITGPNCHDKEKVRRFYEAYPGGHTEEFYSDSLSDSPMAEIADRAFIVDRDKISPWPNK